MPYGGFGLLHSMQANRTVDEVAAAFRLPYRTLIGVGFCFLFVLTF